MIIIDIKGIYSILTGPPNFSCHFSTESDGKNFLMFFINFC